MQFEIQDLGPVSKSVRVSVPARNGGCHLFHGLQPVVAKGEPTGFSQRQSPDEPHQEALR